MSPSQLLLRLSLFVVLLSFVLAFSNAKKNAKNAGAPACQLHNLQAAPYDVNAENFTINFALSTTGQPQFQFMNKKDMKMNYYWSTFLGLQEATMSNSSNTYTFNGDLMTGATWYFCTYPMVDGLLNYSFYGTAQAPEAGQTGSFTAISLNGTVDTTMNMTMMNFPVTKPNLTVNNYHWMAGADSTYLSAQYDLQWLMNGVMQTTENNLYNEKNMAVDWEDAYLQSYTGMDTDQNPVDVTMKIAKQVMKNPPSSMMNTAYGFYDKFTTGSTLTAPLDLGFGNTDKTATNGSGWKIIVSIAVVAVVAVVAIALLGFCLLRRRGRSRSYQRV